MFIGSCALNGDFPKRKPLKLKALIIQTNEEIAPNANITITVFESQFDGTALEKGGGALTETVDTEKEILVTIPKEYEEFEYHYDKEITSPFKVIDPIIVD